MQQWLEDFRNTIDSATPRLAEISEAQSAQPRAEDHWSSKQILGHLIDSAANNHARFVLGQLKDDLLFPGYDQDGWVRTNHYQEASWPQLRRTLARVQSSPDHLMAHRRQRKIEHALYAAHARRRLLSRLCRNPNR